MISMAVGDESSALGMWPASKYEFTVGTMMSLLPFATRVGWADSCEACELTHVGDAPIGSLLHEHLVRPTKDCRRDLSTRAKIRPRNSAPFAMLVSDGEKKK